jgi:Na+-transporting methylmalonyl-CoA/oxaloacetate decarboxylase gamma subunit
MAVNFGHIPMAPPLTYTPRNGFMNRATNAATNFMKTPMNVILLGLGVVLILFLVLVVYNRTVGDRVRKGWNDIRTMLREKGIIKVGIDPGNTGYPIVTAKLDPEPSVLLPPLTAALLPEPVTVPKPADNPPNDTMNIPRKNRPAGMPGSGEIKSIFQVVKKDMKDTFPSKKKEVFNISKNIYTFNDAAAVCAAAGAELATYDQVKEAYDSGADWCNYGWIKGQMAVYPTQKNTWKILQKGSPEFRNACGQPGVNGGYFDNPELRFGVNCYGEKPPQKASDELLDSQVALPQSTAELEFEKRVQRFRDQMDAVAVLPFYKGRWNE